MELRHLRYFVAVADAGGFSRAARLLHVSQSAISEQMRDLEEELGVPLIDRTQPRIRLTAHGSLFLEEARRTLDAASRAIEVARRSLRGEVGTLAIGFFVGGTGSFFPQLIRDFRRLYPGVRISLHEMTPSHQYDALLQGSIDIGFTRALDPSLTTRLRSECFYVEPLVAALPKDHPLAGEAVLDVAQLAGERFIMAHRETSPALFDRIIALCAEAGFSPHIAATASVAPGVLTLVQAGEGVAILPKNAQSFAAVEVAFCPINNPDAAVELVIAWSPQHEGSLHRSFLELARKQRGHDCLAPPHATD